MNSNKDTIFILAHGIMGGDYMFTPPLSGIKHFATNFSASFLNQFQSEIEKLQRPGSISDHLRQKGFETYATNVSMASNIERRSEELRTEIRKLLSTTGRSHVHIIAHSMGGLDARHMISNYPDMEQCVISLNTVATPHLGSYIADVALNNGGGAVIKAIEGFLDLRGFLNLTSLSCSEFNALYEEREAKNSVIYRTYSSVTTPGEVSLIFKISFDFLDKHGGANDGLVPRSSQRWTDKLVAQDGTEKVVIQSDFPMHADHLNQIGWWDINKVASLWQWQPLATILKLQEFEESIKNIYLAIAMTTGKQT